MEVIYAIYLLSYIICLGFAFNQRGLGNIISSLFISFVPVLNTIRALVLIRDYIERRSKKRKFNEDAAKIRRFINNNQAVSAKKIFEGLHPPSGNLQWEYLTIKYDIDLALAKLEQTKQIEKEKLSEKIKRIEEEKSREINDKEARRQLEEKEKVAIQKSTLLVQSGQIIDSFRAQSGQTLDSLSPQDFELIILEAFSRQGYKATHTAFSGDEGVDGFLEKGSKKIAIQCKKHSGSIGQPAIRDFYGAMMHLKCDEGFFLATSDFSDPARDFTENKKIKLFDRQQTLDLLQSTLNNGYVLNGKKIKFPYPFNTKESILSTLKSHNTIDKTSQQGIYLTRNLKKCEIEQSKKPPYICQKCGKEMWSLDMVVEYWDKTYCKGCGSLI